MCKHQLLPPRSRNGVNTVLSYRNEVPAEVVGPAEIDHLSTMAPFRRARRETRAQQSDTSLQMPTSGHSEGTHGRSNHGHQPTISNNAFDPNAAQPTSLPSFASFDLPGDDMSQHAGMDYPDGMQPPTPDYTKIAEEMSRSLTWDAADWWNFDSHNQI